MALANVVGLHFMERRITGRASEIVSQRVSAAVENEKKCSDMCVPEEPLPPLVPCYLGPRMADFTRGAQAGAVSRGRPRAEEAARFRLRGHGRTHQGAQR